jgi:tripeptide aminopeptidase
MINEQRLVDLFCELVQIDAPSRQERAMADQMIELLCQMGCQIHEDQAAAAIGGDCGNLIASLAGALPGAPMLLAVHLDTVEPCRGKQAMISDDGIIRSAGGTILGADDLAGIAAIVEAIRSVQNDGIAHRSLEILLSVAEEQHLTGSHHLNFDYLTAKEAYVLDTSGAPGLAVLQAPGHIGLVFEFFGQAAHAGIAPENGVSAIQAAARGIARLRLGRVDAGSTANIGRIEGGGETNIIADYCRVTAECRSLDAVRLRLLADEMRGILQQAADETGACLAIAETISYLPYQIAPDRPVVRRFTAVCQNLGLPVRHVSTGGGSDNNILAQHGIEGLVLSCGMRNVHSCQEEISISDLVDTARMVRGLICEL